MFKNYFYFLCLSSFLLACKNNKPTYQKFLNKDSLPSQLVNINNSKDTIFQTANGAIIKIEKGSFSKEDVKLQIKEAYSVEQMILAGLTTESGGKPLSSGGMIYVNAMDNDVIINKPLNISIPTDRYNKEMELYEGKEKDGKIDWQNPEPLTSDALNRYLERGKQIFLQNCASCHSYDKDLVGPAMRGVEGRGPWNSRERLIRFTRNPAAFIPRTCYTKDLQHQYGSTMQAFPVLETEELNAIYDYIKNEDMKSGIVYSNNYNAACDDSCYTYDSLYKVINSLNTGKTEMILDNDERINLEWNLPQGSFTNNDDIAIQLPAFDKVEPVNYKGVYYQFNIKTFGWYNVDYLLNTSNVNAELKVEMQGDYKENMSVFIVVPQYKIFDEGGPLNGEENIFGFFEQNGNIPLLAGSKVIVFSIGEVDGKILFDSKKFISTDKQRILLAPKVVSKKEFNRAVRKFRLDDASIKANDSKNASKIRTVDKEIKNSESLLQLHRPKNCDCNCGAKADTSAYPSTPSPIESGKF